jgi:hypothetical protein
MAALKRQEPDRVPFCELGIDRALAERLMGWPITQTPAGGSLAKNPYTVEESKALAAFLGFDCIWYLLRAPTFAHQRVGQEGRGFMGEGMIKSEADLEKIKLPDPTQDEIYREAEYFPGIKGTMPWSSPPASASSRRS